MPDSRKKCYSVGEEALQIRLEKPRKLWRIVVRTEELLPIEVDQMRRCFSHLHLGFPRDLDKIAAHDGSAREGSHSLHQGGTQSSSTISTEVASGIAETVALSVSGEPFGATATFNPQSVIVGSSSTLTVDPGTAAAGTYPLTITGTSASATHSTNVALTISPSTPVTDDFSISASPATLSLKQNSSGTVTISTAVTSGGTQPVTLSVSGVPSNAHATISPNSVNAGGTATLTVDTGSASVDTYTLTITGTGPSGSHTTTISLKVRRGK
jgi:uncharacterized membrane protein